MIWLKALHVVLVQLLEVLLVDYVLVEQRVYLVFFRVEVSKVILLFSLLDLVMVVAVLMNSLVICAAKGGR